MVLGWEKVSCLERCPQFRGVLIAIILYTCWLPWGWKHPMSDPSQIQTRPLLRLHAAPSDAHGHSSHPTHNTQTENFIFSKT